MVLVVEGRRYRSEVGEVWGGGGGGGGKRQIGSYGSAVVAEVEEMIDGGDAADDGCGAGDTW